MLTTLFVATLVVLEALNAGPGSSPCNLLFVLDCLSGELLRQGLGLALTLSDRTILEDLSCYILLRLGLELGCSIQNYPIQWIIALCNR